MAARTGAYTHPLGLVPRFKSFCMLLQGREPVPVITPNAEHVSNRGDLIIEFAVHGWIQRHIIKPVSCTGIQAWFVLYKRHLMISTELLGPLARLLLITDNWTSFGD
jgi:hypothetical protein